ncbi:ATP-binding protein [Yoonia vestfoldensis]|uniref:ATP-binding protein n=1 Tax=Yoonia vestfoldensis TaxID=245188 RepID=UPI000369E744|nr:ATP-binding protein [Yoonia vestfoldensis]
MFFTILPTNRKGRGIAFVAGLVAAGAIALLSYNVSREIRLLGSARSDNVQWSLVQTQVEFLEFAQEIERDPVDLTKLRQEFDIFFSRMRTVNEATVFEALRADATVRQHLADLSRFLDEAVRIVDVPDAVVLQQIPRLGMLASEILPTVRALGNSGLDISAIAADSQREKVARTLTQLALAIAGLIGMLLLAILYLYQLNVRIYRRERENKQTSTRMSTVMGTSLDGVIVCDAQGLILQFSPAAEGIFGYAEKEVLGRDIGAVIVPDHMRKAHDAGMERMRENGEKRVVGKGRVKMEAKHREGRVFPVELAIQSAMTDEGEIFIAFLRDISHRVAAEAELVAARDKALASEKLKTDFLSTMSHEIRTPLNGLLGNMLLLRDTKLNPLQDRYVGYMETSGRLLISHISDVLDITRYDAGKLSTRSRPVNISALLQAIVDNQKSTAAHNETSLHWRWIGQNVGWVLSDHDRLQHVLMNLIGNAVKFTRRGKVSVTVENIGQAQNAELMIKITDTGPGISADLAERIFDDFVTGNAAYDRVAGGTGLGLSIARRFVHALSGEIGVDSVVGEGSTFWVRLPVVQTEAPEEPIADEMALPLTRSLDVLLVEDNEINRMVAREMLVAEGHSVTEAHDGPQGVEAANGRRFDLILMDISMPLMDGRTATRAIRSGDGPSKDTVIVALTANVMVDEQQAFLAAGMNSILTKPLSRNALRTLLSQTSRLATDEETNMINKSHSDETREALGEEAFVKLRSRFVTEVDEYHEWLISDEARDFLEIAARTHKVAGSAAVFGADELRKILRAIETAAKAGNITRIRANVAQFTASWTATKSQLSR